MLNIAICEDCPNQIEVIQMLLNQYQLKMADTQLYVHSFNTGAKLLKSVDSERRYDIFLLDILMPVKNGIEIARELRERDADAPLIFLTSSQEHTMDAFNVWAAQYILKPITKDKLYPVLDRVCSAIATSERQFFTLHAHGRIVTIPFNSITYVEQSGRVLRVNRHNGQTLKGKTLRMPFDKAVASLLEDNRFIRPHNSFVVNMQHVKEIGKASFILKSGVQVPIPRYKYADAKSKYLGFISEYRQY